MNASPAQHMAHLRFGVISPLLSAEDPRPLMERLAELSEKVWTLPDGRLRQFTAATIEDWYYDYRKRGFEALVNPPRRDCGTHRVVGEELCRAIDELLTQYPRVRSSALLRKLDELGLRPDGAPSDSTLYRYLRRIRPQYAAKATERLAFEAPYAGNLYQADLMYGPFLAVRQPSGRSRKVPTYLLAILDDHSRLACHGEFFLTQDLMTYLTVLEKAIRKRGIPDKIYCDNGKVFLSEQVRRIGAEIGCRIVHTKVRDAAAKGKIERFFKTVRMQFLEMIAMDMPKDLAALNRRFLIWMEEYNNRRHSALGCSPMEKWLASPRGPRLLPDRPDTDDLFLLEATRRVKKDGTFALAGRRFETSYVHAGRKITVRYDKADLTRVHLHLDGDYLGVARPLHPTANNNLPRNRGDRG